MKKRAHILFLIVKKIMTELTVILPTKNSEKFINFFLKSLKEQDFQDFYLFVADGSSKDNTINILKEYNFNLSIISTNDVSAGDGINKCLKKVETKFFCILMSDDKLGEKNYISQLIYTLNSGADIAVPNFGTIIDNKYKIKDQKNNFSNLPYYNIAPDIGWMAKTSVLKDGLYPEKYKHSNSYFFLLNLYKKSYVFKRNRNVHYFFRIGGKSYKNGILAYLEQKDISLKFGANKFLVYKILIVNLLKFFVKYKLFKFWHKI